MRLITVLRHQLVFERDEFMVQDDTLNATLSVREITVYITPDTNRPSVSYSGFYKPNVNADDKHYVSPNCDPVLEKDKLPTLIYQVVNKLDGVRVADYDLPLWLEDKI